MLLGDRKPYQILGSCNINIIMFDGCSRPLHNVRYVLKLKRNLISTRTLNANGCMINIDKGIIKVIRGVMTLMKGEIKNGLNVHDG